jgi:hypothetical protein
MEWNTEYLNNCWNNEITFYLETSGGMYNKTLKISNLQKIDRLYSKLVCLSWLVNLTVETYDTGLQCNLPIYVHFK